MKFKRSSKSEGSLSTTTPSSLNGTRKDQMKIKTKFSLLVGCLIFACAAYSMAQGTSTHNSENGEGGSRTCLFSRAGATRSRRNAPVHQCQQRHCSRLRTVPRLRRRHRPRGDGRALRQRHPARQSHPRPLATAGAHLRTLQWKDDARRRRVHPGLGELARRQQQHSSGARRTGLQFRRCPESLQHSFILRTPRLGLAR